MEGTLAEGSSLPNGAPHRLPSKYMGHYHLTQLGVSTPDPTRPADQCNPQVDGAEVAGPQGFMCYTKEFDVLPSLAEYYKTLPVDNSKHSSLMLNGRTSPRKNRVATSPGGVALDLSKTPSTRKSILNIGSANPLLKAPSSSSGKEDKRWSMKKDKTPSIERKSSGSLAVKLVKDPKKKASKKKSETERQARKEEKRRRAALPPIYIEKLSDFPEEALKLIEKAKVPEEKMIANLHVLAHIIRFRTGFNVRTKDKDSQKLTETDSENSNLAENRGSKKLDGTVTTTDQVADEQHQQQLNSNGDKSDKDQKDDDIDSDMLEPNIAPKGGEEQFIEGDVKKLYKNLQASGRGGFGSVFVAKSSLEKCDVAIKKIPHVTKKAKRTNFNEIGFLNFCKHPNIVKYYRSHLVDDEIWLVMEYMHGGTLSEAVDRYSFGESSVAYVAREVLNALEYLHSHNLVHRDLKSANIMLTVEGKIKLIDFGLCVDHTQRKLCHMAGSPFWMPPEMILGIPHGPPADVWSFAICLLELANGKPPNRKSPIRAMFLAATDGITLPKPEKMSEEFKDFLGLCLQIDQTKRATPSELKQHRFLEKADTQETMKKILAQIFISNAISNLDYGL